MKYIDLLEYKNVHSEEVLNRFTSLLLEAHFDEQQKEVWASKLEKEYNVQKPPENKRLKITTKQKHLLWSAVAAVVMFLVWFIYPTKEQFLTIDQLVVAELNQPIPYYGARKGAMKENELRQLAYQKYQEKDYETALNHFVQLQKKGKLLKKDNLFFALTYLYNKNYSQAIFSFESEMLQKGFPERANWFLFLAYYQNGEMLKAKIALEKHLSSKANPIKQKIAKTLLMKLNKKEQ